jgi:rhodanese-related sulfurtransferase
MSAKDLTSIFNYREVNRRNNFRIFYSKNNTIKRRKQRMKRLTIFTLIMVLTIALSGIAIAGKVPTPTDPPQGVDIISAADAKAAISNGSVKVYDMRKALNFGKGHLPGSTSVPYKWTKKGHPAERTGKYDMSKLPEDKETTILFHSDGPNGWKSYYASKEAAAAGYKKVLWMRDGFSSWSEKGYPVEN